ncbi:MAG: exonuclease domain-containing protein [Oscillospiraceae bacterium]|nr:exonuclease domain-containing protein [Oscillospiraceae bacterium]
MAYVILDMEWNQAMSAQSAVFNKLPIRLRGEIIQLGAVKLTDDFMPGEEFQIDVKPIYFKRMHYKVKKLTGFDKDRLLGGIGFKEAFSQFREWCGEHCILLTWGCDDKPVMEQNIIIHDLDWDWVDRWINLQVIYNIQTQAGRNQTGLTTAMEHFNIAQTRIAHDALGDAYNTALVCSKLDLEAGLEQYESASKILATRLSGLRETEKGADAVEHRAFPGYAGRAEAFSDKNITSPVCPVCGERLKCGRWVNQGDRRYMTLCECREHGRFLVRLKLRAAEDGSWTANRIIYKADAEMEKFYAAKAHSPKRRRTRRKKKRVLHA